MNIALINPGLGSHSVGRGSGNALLDNAAIGSMDDLAFFAFETAAKWQGVYSINLVNQPGHLTKLMLRSKNVKF